MNISSIMAPRRIANKIIVLVLVLELISMLLWGVLTYSSSRDELIKSKSGQLSEIALISEVEVGKFFLPIHTEADVISAAITSEANVLNSHISKLLYSFLHRRSEIEEVNIIDSESNVVKTVSRMVGVSKNYPQKVNFSPMIKDALLGKPGISPVSFSEYLDPIVQIVSPINSNNGNNQVIKMTVNLKWLLDTIQTLRVEKSGYVYIVDESLKLVAHPDQSLVLSGLNLKSSTVPQILFEEEKLKELLIYNNFTGKSVAGISYFDPVHRWWIIVEQPVDEALAPLDRVINRFFIAFFLVTFLTIFTVVYFSKLMMRPLEKLEVAIDKLTQGNRGVRVEVPENTELSSLSNAFNEMARNLGEQSDKLEYQAYHDALTKLPNRKKLFEYIDGRLQRRSDKKDNTPFTLLLLDLDRFKEINDSLGHKCGDSLLKELSERLLGLLSHDDLVARLGGDEFAIVLKSSDTVGKAEAIALRVRAIIQTHFEMEGLRLLVDASVGIAMYPTHGQDSSTLVRRADVAMYHAKKTGTGIEVYDDGYDTNTPERLALISELPKAIKENELVLHYQPKISVSDRKMIGVEALVRWQHPLHGMIPPDDFIPIVELGDAIHGLSDWVINQALRDCRTWRDRGIYIDMAINVSTPNIQDADFVDRLEVMLEKHSIKPENIQLEITESIIMADTNRALETISKLDSMGVTISIDDFGTGYSSLAYLKSIPVDELKIDKSFVMDMEENDNDAVIVRSTIDLSHNLGLKVTAEGVETEESLKLLHILDCDYAQGFHICRPIPAEEIMQWAAEWDEKNASLKQVSI